MTTFNAGSIEATLDLNPDPFQRALDHAKQQGREFAAMRYAATLDVDTRAANDARRRLEADLDRFGQRRDVARLEVDGVAQSLAGLRTVQAAADRWGHTRASATIDVHGLTTSLTELETAQARLDAFGRSSATATVGADTSGFQSGIGGAVSGMEALIALGALLAPALVPGLAAAAAAAAALGVALGGAVAGGAVFGAGVIGNVTDIVKAHQTVAQGASQIASATQAAASANVAEANAAHQVQQAEQSLTDARRQQAQATAAAEYQVKEAHYAVTQAQMALNQAVLDATNKLKDYRDQLTGARLDEQAGELAVREARQQLAAVLADPTHTQLAADEATHALQEAEYQLEQTQKSRDKLRAQAKQDRADGVMGSKTVLAAQHQLAEAEHALAMAEQAVANTKRTGAEQVAAAEYALTQAHQAQAAAATQATTAGAALSKQQQAYDAALATVSTPAAQAFLDALDGLKAGWHDFLAGTQGPGLTVVDNFLSLAASILPTLVGPANAVAGAVGGLLGDFADWYESGGGEKLTRWLERNAPMFITEFGGIIGDALGLLDHLGRAFTPFAHELLDGIDGWLHGLRRASRGLAQSPEFAAFIKYVTDNGPKFVHFLGDVGGVFLQIGEALAPLGPPILDGLNAILDSINSLSPPEVALLVAAVGAIVALTVAPVAGTAVAVVALAAAFSGLSSDSSPIAGHLGGIATAAQDSNKWLGRIAESYWNSLKPAIDDMRPDLNKLGHVLNDELAPAWSNFWDTFGPFLVFLAGQDGKRAGTNLKVMVDLMGLLGENMAGDLNLLSGTFSGDWSTLWRGLAQTPIGQMNRAQTNILGSVEDMAAGMLDRLFQGPGSLDTRLRAGFQSMVDAISSIWSGLEAAAGTPVKFVVDYVWNNGLRKVINSIPGVTDLDAIDTSSWPSLDSPAHKAGRNASYAAGGVIPGYSPGRDIHTFYSPTAGTLRLGGGEGILTTRAVDQLGGADGIAELNRRAQVGNLTVLRRMLAEQAYAQGGVVYVDGQPMTKVAAAQLAIAEQASGINNTVVQGSYQPYTSYSGSSHEGGGVQDTVPGDFTMQSWLRKLALAAWARNQPGYPQSATPGSSLGSNMHVHSVSTIDPYANGNAQVAAYRAGGNGMGGADYGPRPAVDSALVDQAIALSGLKVAAVVSGGGLPNPFAKYLAAAEQAKAFAARVPSMFGKLDKMGPWGAYAEDAARYAGNQAVGYVNGLVPGPGPFPSHTFDQGGWMAPGWALNASDKPEAVLTEHQWRALASLAAAGGSTMGGMSSHDVDRIVEAIRANRGVYAQVSSRDDVESALSALGAELRKVG